MEALSVSCMDYCWCQAEARIGRQAVLPVRITADDMVSCKCDSTLPVNQFKFVLPAGSICSWRIVSHVRVKQFVSCCVTLRLTRMVSRHPAHPDILPQPGNLDSDIRMDADSWFVFPEASDRERNNKGFGDLKTPFGPWLRKTFAILL